MACQVEVYSRVTGYFQPVAGWNKGKVEEFRDRNKYKMDQKREEKSK